KAIELKDDAVAATHVVEEKTKEAAHNVQDKAVELKHDAAVVGHNAQEKAKEVAHNVEGIVFCFRIVSCKKYFIDKAIELKDDAVAATHVVEDKTKEAGHNVQAVELKHDAAVVGHDAQQK
ncbi:unnamed protein product, partial [Adineta steineri]